MLAKEPSGGSFNEMKWTEDLENGSRFPFNPMINAGAIAIASMIPDNYNDLGRNFNQHWPVGESISDFYPIKDDMLTEMEEDRVYVNVSRSRLNNRHVRRQEIIDQLLYIYPFIQFLRRLCGDTIDKKIRVDWDLFLSERKTGHNNRSLAWQMNDNKFFDKILARHEIYGARKTESNRRHPRCLFPNVFNQSECTSLGLFCREYWPMAVEILIIKEEGKQLLTPREVAIATSMMSTSGLYNESGEFAYNVGIPSKSGVSGGIVGGSPWERWGLRCIPQPSTEKAIAAGV